MELEAGHSSRNLDPDVSHDLESQQTGQRAEDSPSNEPTRSALIPLTTRLSVYLYISHFLSTWNSRLFEMAAVLFIAAIYPDTLLPVSVYALSRNAAAVILSTAIGTVIDTKNRLHVIRISILGQRLAVAGSCAIFLALYVLPGMSGPLRSGLFAVSIIAACIEKLCSIMNLVSIERDWVVVITEGQTLERQKVNARMRRIDLFCKLVGPLLISLVDGASTTVAIWLTLGFSCASFWLEYITVGKVYLMAPALHQRAMPASYPATRGSRTRRLFKNTIDQVLPAKAFLFYFTHPVFLPSLSLALLYLTVLSFSGQMITYLLSAGYSSTYVGIARAVSTIFELSATWIASRLQNSVGSVRGAIWSINWQALFLTGGLVWFSIYGQTQGYLTIATASGLAAGVILSRIGLWSFDLCVQTTIQAEVEEGQRGAFSTVEAALQNLFELLSYVTTIIFSRPDQFLWPSVISTAAVYLAGGLYTLFVRQRRGHLLHRPSWLKI